MKDQVVIELLRQQIVALGVDLYLAEHDPRPGLPLADKVIEAIHRADAEEGHAGGCERLAATVAAYEAEWDGE